MDGIAQAIANAASDLPLSSRQTEVLLMICDGLTSKEIANKLGISPKTVEFHKASLFDKTRLRSTALLVRYAIRNGLITA